MSTTRIVLVIVIAALGFGCDSHDPDAGLAAQIGKLMNEAPTPPGLDRIAPANVVTLFENQHATVLRLELSPGESIPAHTARARIVFALREGDLSFSHEGDPAIASYSVGEADIWGASRYAISNPGPEPVELLVVTRSETPLPPSSEPTMDEPNPQSTSDVVKTLTADQRFAISEVSVPADSAAPLELDRPCVVYTLTPAEFRVVDTENEQFRIRAEADRVLWLSEESRPVLTAGAEPARAVLVEFKM